MDQDAGNRRLFLHAGAACLVAAGTGCTAAAVETEGRERLPLEPVFSIAGARLITRTDAAGGATFGALGAYVPLIFPVAAAASFNDVYIADVGASRLYRYDRALDGMAVLPETRISMGTRMQTGPDGSVYVLDPLASEIRRYSRGGQTLPPLRPRLGTSRYAGFALDPVTGKAYALDGGHLTIDEIQPLGTLAIEIQRLEEPGPIATDGRGLFIGSARCGCVVEWINGRMGRRLGAGKLRQPLSIAVIGPQVFAIDAAQRSVMLLHEEGADALPAARLGLLMPDTLNVADGMLLIADGAGHRVAAFRPRTKRKPK